ncbi:MAG: hypothetical protein QOF89_5523 [Acidobacteriota bacterium]|nr:hypothetical protein [Acidobacteriota bacterium]
MQDLLAGFFGPLLGLAATAWGLGRGATRALGLAFDGRLEKGAVSTALGLALTAHLLLLLGLAGWLRVLPLLLIAACIHLLGIPVWRETWDDLRRGGLGPLGWVGLILLILPFALPALYPPTAFDATLYHLPFARAFVATGGVPYLADLRFPVFPQANEILFAAVMLGGHDMAAQGAQVLATLLTALLLGLWGRREFPAWPAAGPLAATVFLGSPLVAYLAGTGYVEPGLTLFVAGGFYAAERWRQTGARRWLVPAAVLAATAADVKYLGLYFLGVIALIVLIVALSRGRVRDVLLFAAVALAVLAPWYLRILLLTGNPVFPYAPQLFGANPWQSLPDPHRQGTLIQRLVRVARLPWDLVFARETYGGLPLLSPVYLASLPLLAMGSLRDRRVRLWLALTAIYALACTWLPRDSRYLVPALSLASLAVAGSIAVLISRWRSSRSLAWVLCLGCLAPGWLYGLYRVQRNGPLPVTAARREVYLARKIPLYSAVAWLNHTRGSGYTVWALNAEQLNYFADGRYLGDWTGPASFDRIRATCRTPEALHRELRRLGADHLLLPKAAGKGLPFPEDALFQRWFQLVYEDAEARVYALR